MSYTIMAVRQAQSMGHPFPEQIEAVMQDTWGGTSLRRSVRFRR